MITTLSELMYNKGMKKQTHSNTQGENTVMTRREIAKHFKVAPDTITRWTKEGLPALYIGKVRGVARGARPRYLLSQVMTWLENQQSGIIW